MYIFRVQEKQGTRIIVLTLTPLLYFWLAALSAVGGYSDLLFFSNRFFQQQNVGTGCQKWPPLTAVHLNVIACICLLSFKSKLFDCPPMNYLTARRCRIFFNTALSSLASECHPTQPRSQPSLLVRYHSHQQICFDLLSGCPAPRPRKVICFKASNYPFVAVSISVERFFILQFKLTVWFHIEILNSFERKSGQCEFDPQNLRVYNFIEGLFENFRIL